MVVEKLRAGEFEAVTGLSAKALRLYGERGILAPASVNPDNGYRSYHRRQLQHGMVVDLLRKARVPVTELPSAHGFDFENHRQSMAVQRLMEDFTSTSPNVSPHSTLTTSSPKPSQRPPCTGLVSWATSPSPTTPTDASKPSAPSAPASRFSTRPSMRR